VASRYSYDGLPRQCWKGEIGLYLIVINSQIGEETRIFEAN